MFDDGGISLYQPIVPWWILTSTLVIVSVLLVGYLIVLMRDKKLMNAVDKVARQLHPSGGGEDSEEEAGEEQQPEESDAPELKPVKIVGVCKSVAEPEPEPEPKQSEEEESLYDRIRKRRRSKRGVTQGE